MTQSQTTAAVTATLAPEGLAVDIKSETGFLLRVDEPADLGGANSGPDPFTYLYTSLASCILITLKMYAVRKSWPLRSARLRLSPTERNGFVLETIEYELDLEGDLDDKQLQRLREIAERCPVHRSLTAGIRIQEREHS